MSAGLFFVGIQSLEHHRTTIIRIPGAHHSNFVPVIQDRNPGDGHDEGLQHLQPAVPQGVLNFHRPIPACRYGIFVEPQGTGSVSDKARHIMVPRYIPHAVLMTVEQERLLQTLAKHAQIAAIARQGGTGIEIEIEIKLGINHPASDIGSYQLPTPEGFPDLVNRALLRSHNTLLDFAGQGPPKNLRDMLGGIVPETIQGKLLQPIQGRITHRSVHLRTLQIQTGHEGIKPSRKAMLIPNPYILAPIRQIQGGNPIRMLLQERMFLMHMIRHIIQQNVDTVRMRCIDKFS